MSSIHPAYDRWAQYQQRLRDVISGLTSEHLSLPSGAKAWPIWATVGHTACQRVFWLCDFLGEPGAETTPFTNASYNCPGDDDLENVLDSARLVEGLDSSFRIVERCLAMWSLDMLQEVVRRPDFGDDWVHTRGSVLQRVFSHDVYHCAELNLTLGDAGLPQIDLWD